MTERRKFTFGNPKNANWARRKGWLMLNEGLSHPENAHENLDHVRNYLQNEDTTKELLSYLPAENAPPPTGSLRGGSKSRRSKSRRSKCRRSKSRRSKSRRSKSRRF